jgi:hypothetical protein
MIAYPMNGKIAGIEEILMSTISAVVFVWLLCGIICVHAVYYFRVKDHCGHRHSLDWADVLLIWLSGPIGLVLLAYLVFKEILLGGMPWRSQK